MNAPKRVVICGGGVAAVEALLALREILAIRPHVRLVAPGPAFVYSPMAVAEPFGLVRTKMFDLAAIAEDLGAELDEGSLAAVDGENHTLVLDDGVRVPYDAAIVAVGARPCPWLEGALTFAGPRDSPALEALLARMQAGEISRVAFTCPAEATWTLPVYELAMLTSAWAAEQGLSGIELSVLTPEPEPLGVFGAGAARMVASQLADRGIRLQVGTRLEGFANGRLQSSQGAPPEVDEVVALPRLEGPRIDGLPADEDGFILVDEHCRVEGLTDVFAAGDGICSEVKQGGLATQQADIAAECVAAALGAPVKPPAFEPMLRGMLLTGVAPMFMRAGGDQSEVAANPLWWPPTKIAGRYLGPYLAFADTIEKQSPLEDRAALAGDPERALDNHQEARRMALVFAEADAHGGDFHSALRWLEVIEQLDGVLAPEYLDRRELWSRERPA